ncbi:MAG TPA: hypothetical protein VJT81_19805 [Burkholderiales bacterium]|nr:hypothetical protein [Burkholderiales bacterium]
MSTKFQSWSALLGVDVSRAAGACVAAGEGEGLGGGAVVTGAGEGFGGGAVVTGAGEGFEGGAAVTGAGDGFGGGVMAAGATPAERLCASKRRPSVSFNTVISVRTDGG